MIGDKTLTGKEIKDAILESEKELMQMATHHAKANDNYHAKGNMTELVVRHSKVHNNAFVLRYNSIDDINNENIPKEEREALVDFLNEVPKNSVVIFAGYDGFLYSSHANKWKSRIGKK